MFFIDYTFRVSIWHIDDMYRIDLGQPYRALIYIVSENFMMLTDQIVIINSEENRKMFENKKQKKKPLGAPCCIFSVIFLWGGYFCGISTETRH